MTKPTSEPAPENPTEERLRRAREHSATHGSPIEAPGDIRADIGARIASLRTQKKLNKRQLADAVDVTPGMISQLEHGHVMPSIATLLRIASVLGVHIGDFFGERQATGMVVRRHERPIYHYPLTGVHDELISSDPTGRLQVFVSTLDAGASSGSELLRHGSDAEVVLVLEGRVEISVGEAVLDLSAGDSVSFSGTVPHGYRNPHDAPAELIWIVTPASY